MRLWSIGTLRPLSVAWRRLSLVQQFSAAVGLAIGVNMLAIGYWAERRIVENAISTMAETSAVYVEGVLSPHIQGLGSADELTTDNQERIASLIRDTQLATRLFRLEIWALDGRLVHSMDSASGHKAASTERATLALQQAAAGIVVVDFGGPYGVWPTARPRRVSVYTPLYRTGTRTPVAVGVFDEDTDILGRSIGHHRNTMWLSIAVFTGIIIGLVSLIVARGGRTIERQRAKLVGHLQTLSHLARRNGRLHRIAERSRLNTVAANEAYLAGVSADLHDGPIQVLALAMFKFDAAPTSIEAGSKSLEASDLVQQAIQELRSLATGLVLPEIAAVTLEEAIRMAVTRHMWMTDSHVLCSIGPLPKAFSTDLKICVYRVIQESLSNSYKHAKGLGQSVTASMAESYLEISIHDRGDAPWSHAESQSTLGLRGLTNRVKALRGTLSVHADPGVGTRIEVRIPVRSDLA